MKKRIVVEVEAQVYAVKRGGYCSLGGDGTKVEVVRLPEGVKYIGLDNKAFESDAALYVLGSDKPFSGASEGWIKENYEAPLRAFEVRRVVYANTLAEAESKVSVLEREPA